MTRDLTAKQFTDALSRNGMKLVGFMGYVEMEIAGTIVSVSYLNANSDKRRTRLAYLLKEQERLTRKAEVSQ